MVTRRSPLKTGSRSMPSASTAYSAGWWAHATGLPARATELSCRAEGVARCRILAAHADRLEDRLRDARLRADCQLHRG
jgi:hypothetical protein